MPDDRELSMQGFRRICVEIGAALVLAVVTGVATSWALPIALLLFTLAGLTVVAEREERERADMLDEPVEEPEAIALGPAPPPTSAVVLYRPPGPLVRR